MGPLQADIGAFLDRRPLRVAHLLRALIAWDGPGGGLLSGADLARQVHDDKWIDCERASDDCLRPVGQARSGPLTAGCRSRQAGWQEGRSACAKMAAA
jgi:hypothetical protein